MTGWFGHRSREHRRRMNALHCKRWGASEGHCTVRGVHVPIEHREPVRYWSDWWSYHYGEEDAKQFIADLKAGDWKLIPRLRELWNQKKQISHNSEIIRDLVREAWHRENQDSR